MCYITNTYRNTDSIFQNYITHVYYKMDRQLMGEVSVENRNGHWIPNLDLLRISKFSIGLKKISSHLQSLLFPGERGIRHVAAYYLAYAFD